MAIVERLRAKLGAARSGDDRMKQRAERAIKRSEAQDRRAAARRGRRDSRPGKPDGGSFGGV
jgi:hypothetical protein